MERKSLPAAQKKVCSRRFERIARPGTPPSDGYQARSTTPPSVAGVVVVERRATLSPCSSSAMRARQRAVRPWLNLRLMRRLGAPRRWETESPQTAAEPQVASR
jgi:hypothetical protein